ncbi:MAG: aspartate 1-decarboxylase [Candidatus Goldiibacteriota bacterium HGW-Goldbacteria-1]|jgi:aspartate 1-decarboxylase|nr:MAG: aspartate 1-decarboxylase [Candidatus Goldiibacteriota bacterium HGW-Goldbacteria-1]
MMIEMLKSKIHRATVTDKHLEYEGSITIDPALTQAAGIRVHEKVHVLDLNNGQRFETYVISGRKNSGEICVNGAAARLVEAGDKVIIIAYGFMNEEELLYQEAKIVKVDDKNKILKKKVKK